MSEDKIFKRLSNIMSEKTLIPINYYKNSKNNMLELPSLSIYVNSCFEVNTNDKINVILLTSSDIGNLESILVNFANTRKNISSSQKNKKVNSSTVTNDNTVFPYIMIPKEDKNMIVNLINSTLRMNFNNSRFKIHDKYIITDDLFEIEISNSVYQISKYTQIDQNGNIIYDFGILKKKKKLNPVLIQHNKIIGQIKKCIKTKNFDELSLEEELIEQLKLEGNSFIMVDKLVPILYYTETNTKNSDQSIFNDCFVSPSILENIPFKEVKSNFKYINLGSTDMVKYNSVGSKETSIFYDGILVDSGLVINDKINIICITHCHLDHIKNLVGNIIKNLDNYELVPYVMILDCYKNLVTEFLDSVVKLYYKDDKIIFPKDKIITESNFSLLIGNNRYSLEQYKMCHPVPACGYGISNDEKPLFFYSGDTAGDVIFKELNDTYNHIANRYPYIFHEVSFFDSDDLDKAINDKHTHISQIMEFVENNQQVNWIFVHPSAKYKQPDLQTYINMFDEMNIQFNLF